MRSERPVDGAAHHADSATFVRIKGAERRIVGRSQVVWIITSNDWSDNREGEHSYTNEAVFLAGLQELLQNPKKEFISATLPTGKVLGRTCCASLGRAAR